MVTRDVLPERPPGRGPGRAGSTTLVALAAAAALLLAVGLWWMFARERAHPVGADVQVSGKPRVGTSGTPAATSATEPIAPDATFTNTCRYLLGNSTTDPKKGFRLIAQSKIVNTGNTGIEVDVQAWWLQGDQERVTQTKRAKVDERATVTVRLSVPVTRKEIDLIRAHTGPGANCQVSADIVATY